MKAVLVKDVLAISGSDMWNRESYPIGDGTYIVDDGATYWLVVLEADRVATSLAIPREMVVLEEYAGGKPTSFENIEQKIDALNKEMREFAQSSAVSMENVAAALRNAVSSGENGGISGSDLIKALAISKDPKILKDL